jgi:DNA-binding NarL/FixJ family response regulator
MESIDSITAWATGLFEGEGTVGIVNNRVTVTIQMTDKDILDRMQENFGGYLYECKKQQEHHKMSWKWVISDSAGAIEFLNKIYPLLGQRRRARVNEAREAFSGHRNEKMKRRISEVKELRESGLTHQAIADKLNLNRTYVSHILRGRYG